MNEKASTKVGSRNVQRKYQYVLCQCGCNRYFAAEYKTRMPRYVDINHRRRAENNRRRERLAASKTSPKARQTRAERVASEELLAWDFLIPKWDLGDKTFRASVYDALVRKFSKGGAR